MGTDKRSSFIAWRRLARFVVASSGIVCIVGSGGGAGLDCFDACIDTGPIPPSVRVQPARTTVQVGTAATLKANVASFASASSIRWQWCRRPTGAAVCTDIAGADSPSLTLTGVNLGDDGAQFQVTVTDANGMAQASGVLAVSSAPGVVFADADFADANWSVIAVVGPTPGAAMATASRSASGGNPGAFRALSYGLPQAPSSIRIFHTSTVGAYAPAASGAIYVIDFALDCARLSWDGANGAPDATPMVEQGGRRFVPVSTAYDGSWLCTQPDWQTPPPVLSVGASEFTRVDGPACGAGEACPDFSAQAAPIRFGFATSIDVIAGASTGSIVQGIDNWKVTVWRR